MTLVVFLLVLSFLVLIHEFGHFIAARIFGIGVEEFGIGYPPKAKTLFRKWGVEFTLNWLPFGGFVRLLGEERSDSVAEQLAGKVTKLVRGDEPFYAKKKWQRIIVIVAGAAMNFLFGAVAFSIVYSVVGIPTTLNGVEVSEVMEPSPAAEAGLSAGDVVVGLEMASQKVAISDVDQFVEDLKQARGETVNLEVLRNGEERNVSVYVRRDDEIPEGQGSIGVAITERVELVKSAWWIRPWQGMWEGIKAAVAFGAMIVVALLSMVKQLFTAGTVPADVSGPVGIVYTASKEGILKEGWLAVLHFAGILSINLAIVNVLPVPALDGGRVVFILLEKVLGDKFKPTFEHYANVVGFALLLTLIVLVSLRDVGVIFRDFGIGVGGFSKMFGG